MTLPFHDKKFLWLLFCVAVAVTLEVLSLLNMHMPSGIEPFFFAVFILGIGYSVLWKGLKALSMLRFSSINLLMLIAVIGAFYLGEYEEAAVVIVLYVLGERLEDIGIASSKAALNALIEKTPKVVTVEGVEQPVPIDKVEVGTIIYVKPGNMIPLDGEIVEGNTLVDEAPITGEPLPKDKREGDTVFGSTLNRQGFIKVKTTKKLADTVFSRIIQITFEAQKNKSETQQFIEKFAKVYTPSVIVIAALLFVIPVFALGKDFNHWLNQAIAVLVIACPCALVISTPVAIYAAIGNASQKGAVIKGGKYVEALARMKVLCLDKTRTITYGKPVVTDIIPLNGTSREELLACTAGAELFSEHPLAQAIVDACKKEGLDPHAVENFESIMGKGAKADCLVCEDEQVLVGKLEYLQALRKVQEEAVEVVERLQKDGKTSVVVSFKDDVAGIFGITDEIKPDSLAAIDELNLMEVDTIMLTGDNAQTAKYVANEVGIRQVYGNMLPEEKAAKVKQLTETFKQVGMAGDGVNDAPAFALSSVGIAMGAAGSDTAIETAQVVLMNDKLSLLPFLIRLSRATLKRIKWNTVMAVSIKIIFLILAFAGMSNLALAITADVGVTLVVIVTSLRLMNFKHQ